MVAARLGVRRGCLEMGHSLSNRADQIWIVTINAAFVLVLVFQRDSDLSGTGFSLALATLPGLIGMNIAMGGWMGTAQTLAVEREDGTLLRAKSTPNGMLGYLVARITLAILSTALGLVVFVVAGLFLAARRDRRTPDGVADAGRDLPPRDDGHDALGRGRRCPR